MNRNRTGIVISMGIGIRVETGEGLEFEIRI